MDASNSAAAKTALRSSSAASTTLRTSLTVLPTAARSSLATWPMPRRYPVRVPAFPSTLTRTFSSASDVWASEMLASVASRSWTTSSTIAIVTSFIFGSNKKRALSLPWGRCRPFQGREKALAVPPWLTKALSFAHFIGLITEATRQDLLTPCSSRAGCIRFAPCCSEGKRTTPLPGPFQPWGPLWEVLDACSLRQRM